MPSISSVRQSIRDRVARLLRRHRVMVARGQDLARFTVELSRLGAQQLRRDAAHQMAAALAYRTLFALLPLFVLGTILVRALGGFTQFRESFKESLSSLGVDQVTIQPLPTGGATEEEPVEVSQTLADFIMGLLSEVENLNLAAITWVGVAVLCYSATSLMSTVEGSFNRILHVTEGRPWIRRLPVYWTTITVAPAALAMTRYVNAQFDSFIESMISWRWSITALGILWSFVVTWLVVFAMYRIVPNAVVKPRPALIGAFVTAVLLEVGKGTLDLYLARALSLRQLYGSLGLVPLFMLWVYIMWFVVLFGLEVTAIMQQFSKRDRRNFGRPVRGFDAVIVAEPALALTVAEVVARHFSEGRSVDVAHIAAEIALPESTVGLIISRLVEEGILRRVSEPDEGVTLAMPAERIDAVRVLEIGFELVSARPEPGGMIERLRAAQVDRLSGRTLGPV